MHGQQNMNILSTCVYGLESEKNDISFVTWLLKFNVTTVTPFTI